MNPKALTISCALLGFASYSNAQLSALAITGLSSGAAALATGGLTAFLSPAGAVAIGIGLVGAGIVKKALAANVAGLGTRDFRNFGAPRARGKRDSGIDRVAALEQIDAYFYNIANIDVDDCGKRLVCEVEAQDPSQRSEEETLIAGLFGDSPLDPANPKAEYDLAATLGSSSKSKLACARRYHKCPVDRRTILQGIQKQKATAFSTQF
jgi:hypothetical protein